MIVIQTGQGPSARVRPEGRASGGRKGDRHAACGSRGGLRLGLFATTALAAVAPVLSPAPAAAQTVVDQVLADTGGAASPLIVADGEDATLIANNGIYAGYSGLGTIRIFRGASMTAAGGSLVIGYSEGAVGDVLVSGQGSKIELLGSTSPISVGRGGHGNLWIDGGGQVVGRYSIRIGDDPTGWGKVTVADAGSLLASTRDAPTYVGYDGYGELHIVEGGRVDSMWFAAAGHSVGSVGIVRVQGTGSLWTVRSLGDPGGNLYIGENGTGTVVVGAGGVIDLGDTVYSHVSLGVNAGSSGELIFGAARGEGPLGAGSIVARSIMFGSGSGTLTFNHNEDDYVFGVRLQKDVFAGPEYGEHAIHHLAGRTRYTGIGTGFDGTATISGGTFLVDGRLGGQVMVESGGTLGGSGRVGSVTVADGGILAPGSSIGTLTVDGDLGLSAGSILAFELGAPGPGGASFGVADRIDVSGNLVLNGTLNLLQSSAEANGTIAPGYYRLITYGGSLSGVGLTLGSAPGGPGLGYQVQAGNNRVDLFVAPLGDEQLQHWQGGDGLWNAVNPQWLNRDGGMPVAWAGNHAVFRNEPGGFDGGTISVEGSQAFAGLQFVDEGYRIEGDGTLQTLTEGSEIRVLSDSAEIAAVITGPGGIVKTEGGTLILSGRNLYQGGTRILGGVVQVAEDSNLGDASGGLTFDGGTLATSADLETSRAIALDGAGGFDVASGRTLTLSGPVTGAGDLVKTGAGILHLTGSNAYGDTFVEDGRLIGTAGSIGGNIVNHGQVEFRQDGDGRFPGSIDGTGTMHKSGAGTLVLDGASSLDWTVGAGSLAAAAARFTGNVLLDGGETALSFRDDGDAVYAGVISGSGRFSLDGTGTVLLTGDSSGFAGRAVVAGGTLLVGDPNGRGALGGSLEVLSGAALGGSGTVGSGPGSTVAVAAGATLSPGNSIGTLTIDGDLVLASGSQFRVEVNPSGVDADRVAVTGDVTLEGGSVAHIGAPGTYALRSTYGILSAGGRLSGAFDGVISDFAFLDPNLIYDYDAGTVDLALVRNDRPFASVAATPNQVATARAIDGIGFASGHSVHDAVVQLADDDRAIRAAFDALSGEIHASVKTALVEDSRFLRSAANARLRAALRAGEGGGAIWGQGFGSWGSSDGDANAAALDRDIGGLLLGLDGRIGAWRAGVVGGYSHSSFDAAGRMSSGSSDSIHLGLYGGTAWGRLGLRFVAGYTWHAIDMDRAVVFSGMSERLGSDHHAGTSQLSGELGYDVALGGGTSLEPFVNLAHVDTHGDGFGEDGGAAALSVRGGGPDVTFASLGLRGDQVLDFGGAQGLFSAAVAWRHAFGDRRPESLHAFSAGDAFTVTGVPIARNAAVVEAGFDLRLPPRAALGLSYGGQLAGSARDHGLKGSLVVRF